MWYRLYNSAKEVIDEGVMEGDVEFLTDYFYGFHGGAFELAYEQSQLGTLDSIFYPSEEDYEDIPLWKGRGGFCGCPKVDM